MTLKDKELRSMLKVSLRPRRMTTLVALPSMLFIAMIIAPSLFVPRPKNVRNEGLTIVGQIRCRLPKNSLKYLGLAEILRAKSGKKGPSFLVQEQGLEAQTGTYIELRESDLTNMEQSMYYESKIITIPLTSHRAVTEILLYYGSTEGYMLSGLPRAMYKSEPAQKGESDSSTLFIKRLASILK